MTSVVGILCSDGAVIGTDSSATFSQGQIPTVEQPYEKIFILGDRVIVAGTGQIGLGQRFCNQVQKALNDKIFESNSAIDVGRKLTISTINDFAETHANKGQFGALLAYPTGQKPNLCEFSVMDFQPELKNDRLWYVTMGSAQPITDTFMAFIREVFWKTGLPTLNEAVFAVTWTLDHAVAINAGGVNGPVRIAILEQKTGKLRARLLDDDELSEHRQNIEEGKNLLRQLRIKQQPNASSDIPSIPPPVIQS